MIRMDTTTIRVGAIICHRATTRRMTRVRRLAIFLTGRTHRVRMSHPTSRSQRHDRAAAASTGIGTVITVPTRDMNVLTWARDINRTHTA